MWLEAKYQPCSPFSFKEIGASNVAASSLLFPTPFGVKMALIANSISKYNREKGRDVFEIIKCKDITFNLPEYAIKNKTFNSYRTFSKTNNKFGDNVELVKKSTKPAFREYVVFYGKMSIAIDINDISEENVNLLKRIFRQIDYFGKRNSFMQFIESNRTKELDEGYLLLLDENDIDFSNDKMPQVQLTEDMHSDLTFEQIDAYSLGNKKENTIKGKRGIKKSYMVYVDSVFSNENYTYYKISKKQR